MPNSTPPTTQETSKISTHRGGLRGKLNKYEIFWREHYNWLLERGYQLRSRYHPDWKPSWEGTGKRWYQCTDGQNPPHRSVLDAKRSLDGELLLLKCIKKSVYPYEAEIGQYFSTAPIASNPHNHCVPIYEVLHVPDDEDLLVLVMPLLRRFDEPRFDTVGEAVEFFRQIFEGLQFMHHHNIAHRDATLNNVMMDARPLYLEPFHPAVPREKLDLSGPAKHLTRTQRPVKYYLTDFGLSRRYTPDERPPLEDVIVGGDKTVPEFVSLESCDPFPTDVYTIGNMIKVHFIEGTSYTSAKLGLDFMNPLLADMTHTDPSKRPTMAEVVERFEKICNGLPFWTLRSRVIKADDSYITGFTKGLAHWNRRIKFIIKRTPPIPRPA